MKPDYTELDKALLDLIDNGCNTMMRLDSAKSGMRPLTDPFRSNMTAPSRIIERRLQALRKRGTIHFNGKAWVRE